MTNSPKSPNTEWRTRTAGDLSELAQARVEAINIVQWLARIANSYVLGDTPDRRTRLEFRADDLTIVTAQFDKGIALEMRLPTLELQFLDNGKPKPHAFNPQERSPAEVEAWLLVELLHRGIDRDKFSKELPYAIPGLMSGDAEDYSPQLSSQGLICLTALMQDAAAILNAAGGGGQASSVMCLPKTLELTSPSEFVAETGGLAFSPGDAESPEPSFYLRDAAGHKGGSAIKASALMTERDSGAAAAKLRHLVFKSEQPMLGS